MAEAVPASRHVPAPIRRRLGITAVITPEVLLRSLLCTARLKLRGVSCGPVRCTGHLPKVLTRGEVRIGSAFGLDSRMEAVELGATDGGALDIGDRVSIGSGSSVVASHRIEIGDDVLIADRVGIFDTDFHAVDASTPKRVLPVRIGPRAWLCRGATIMPGVEIGANSVVAAGAVVTHDVPPDSLVAGVPARVVRTLDIPPGWRRSRLLET